MSSSFCMKWFQEFQLHFREKITSVNLFSHNISLYLSITSHYAKATLPLFAILVSAKVFPASEPPLAIPMTCNSLLLALDMAIIF